MKKYLISFYFFNPQNLNLHLFTLGYETLQEAQQTFDNIKKSEKVNLQGFKIRLVGLDKKVIDEAIIEPFVNLFLGD